MHNSAGFSRLYGPLAVVSVVLLAFLPLYADTLTDLNTLWDVAGDPAYEDGKQAVFAIVLLAVPGGVPPCQRTAWG